MTKKVKPRAASKVLRLVAGTALLGVLATSSVVWAQPFSNPIMFDIGEGNLKVAIGRVITDNKYKEFFCSPANAKTFGERCAAPLQFSIRAYVYPTSAESHARIAGIVTLAYRSICGALEIKLRVVRSDLPGDLAFGDGSLIGTELARLDWLGTATSTSKLDFRVEPRWPSFRQIQAHEFNSELRLSYSERGMPDEQAARRALTETRRRFGLGEIVSKGLTPQYTEERAFVPVPNFNSAFRNFISDTCRGYRENSD